MDWEIKGINYNYDKIRKHVELPASPGKYNNVTIWPYRSEGNGRFSCACVTES